MTHAPAGGRLTTHILDTASGKPAAGVTISLFALAANGTATLVSKHVTNADGRCDAPILTGDSMKAGVYELVFEIGAYFRANTVALADPAFLDLIPIRFGLADASAHYHVPLLVSPYGYSTYRGS
jgi:5-hydroxyisourate hydrolase